MPETPTGIRRFKLELPQNVAGLWLKYGAKPFKIETYSLFKNLGLVRRFVDINR
jgi:hypothetical protein